MSQCFRPVKEVWNTHSSCFIESETLITLLHDLAARVATASDDHAYGDNTAVWFKNGNKVLDYIERDQRFSPDSFKESLEEQGVRVQRADLPAYSAICGAWLQSGGIPSERTANSWSTLTLVDSP